tara:strand:- start:101 stop:370 length:270 start_codon:yes stop_codon:yes gene_type:complete
MKRYRVWGYETIPYYIDLEANNKQDAYQKAFDVDHMDWIQTDTTGLWDTTKGFVIKKKDIERIESNVVEFKPKETWVEGYKKWKEESND